jgi:hypothetical protein
MGFLDEVGQTVGGLLGGFNARRRIDKEGFDWQAKAAQDEALRQQQNTEWQQGQDDRLVNQLADVSLGAPQGTDAGPAPEPDLESMIPQEVQGARRKFMAAQAAGKVAQSKPALQAQTAYNQRMLQGDKDAAAQAREETKGEIRKKILDHIESIRQDQQMSPREKELQIARAEQQMTMFGLAEAGRNARFQQGQEGLNDRFSRGPSGAGGGRSMASGDVNRISEMDTALGLLRNELGPQMAETGAGSKAGAILPNFISEYTGIGTASKARQALIDKAKQIIGKSLEGGVLRKEDEIKYTKILPTIGDPPEVALAKVEGLAQTIGVKRDDLLRALTTAGYRTSGFRLGAGKPKSGKPKPIRSMAEWNALPSGSKYLGSDGFPRTKP